MSRLVSVVIAVRDGAPFVADAVGSVRSQTHPDVELIVVDDGSTDGTVDVLRRLAVDRLIELPENAGVSTARNIGTATARGEFVTYLDADDRMTPDKVEAQLRHLDAHPECDAVLAHQRIELDPGVVPPWWLTTSADTLTDPPHLPISAMFRTSALVRSGGFDPSFRTSEEMALLFRLERDGGNVQSMPDVLVHRRIHGANATYQTELMHRDLVRALRPLTDPARLPLVTVVIPVRNGARYLAEAVASVREQGVERVQVVVVDDGSTDDTAAVAAALDPAVEVVRQPPLGIGPARNHGVLVARARYIALLDSDDVWAPGALSAQLDALDADPSLDMVFGQVAEFVSADVVDRLGVTPRAVTEAHLASAGLIRRAALARVGQFRMMAGGPEWAEWYSRAVDAGLRVGAVPMVVARRRLHGDNHSLRHQTASAGYVALLRDTIERRRRSDP